MIKPWILDLIKDAAEANDVDLRTDYSGRGMYGRRCVGLTGNRQDVNAAIAEVIKMAVQELFTETVDADGEETTALYNKNDDVQQAIDILVGEQQQDSMGFDIIVYWPDLQWPEEESEDEDDN